MASAKKFTQSETRAQFKHNFRENKHYGNESVDLSKTKNNIIFCDRGAPYLKKRAEEVYIYGRGGKRSDTVYTVGVVCHIPKRLPPGISEKDFFSALDKCLNDMFGKKNCVCSVVHNDEYTEKTSKKTGKTVYTKNTAHLHYMFMPVVYDKKREREKLCAKEIMTRDFLKSFHQNLEQAVSKELNAEIRLTLDEEEKKDFYFKNIEDLKKMKRVEDEERKKIHELRKENQEAEKITNENKAKHGKQKEIIERQEETKMKNAEILQAQKEEMEEYEERVAELSKMDGPSLAEYAAQVEMNYKREHEENKIFRDFFNEMHLVKAFNKWREERREKQRQKQRQTPEREEFSR